jgi:hypothetical protein
MRAMLILPALLAGCAFYSPQRHVGLLDPKGPKYHTAECVKARDSAMAYDDKMAQRIAIGAGAGTAGPIGIAAAIQIDREQAKVRDAAKAEVDKACT